MSEAFTDAIRDDPKDDLRRLIYADWLDERSDPESAAKAEFLRLTVQLAADAGKPNEPESRKQRLQELAAGLATDWLAAVSRLPVENCRGPHARMQPRPFYSIRFDFVCDCNWADLTPTEDSTVRFCGGCQQTVHYCSTIADARQRAWSGHCIAIDPGVVRIDGDLQPRRVMLGRVSPPQVEPERIRTDPAAASAERARRRRDREARQGNG